MKLLLDTNVFIWLNDSPRRVSENVMSIISNPDNELCLRLTSIWEMQIKIQLGKLQLSDSLPEIVKTQQVENNLERLANEVGNRQNIIDIYLSQYFYQLL